MDSIILKEEKEKKYSLEVTEKAKTISKGLSVSNHDTITNLGLETQRKLGNYSNELLDKVKSRDSGDVGEIINTLLGQINHIDVGHEKNKALSTISSIPGLSFLVPVIEMFVKKGKNFSSKYKSVASNIDDISLKLEGSRGSIRKDNSMLTMLFEKSMEHINELDSSILAGRMKIEELKIEIASFSDDDTIDDYMKKDTVDFMQNLDKKVHNLDLARNIAYQSLYQIKMIQENNRQLENKIIDTVNNVIPLWRKSVAMALTLQNQKSVIEIQNKVEEATNDMLRKNSELLKINSIETAKANQSSIVNVETIQKTNDDIITTVNEVMRLNQEGMKKRAEASEKLQLISKNLETKLIEIKNNSIDQSNLLTE